MEKKQIVEKLKKEHKEIIDILSLANKGYGFSDSKWKEALIRAKKLFEGHLDSEDETIYNSESFNKADFGDYSETAKRFHEEMQDITVSVEQFFKKYSTTTDFPEFRKDYAGFVNILQKRINAEETVLFEQYLKN